MALKTSISDLKTEADTISFDCSAVPINLMRPRHESDHTKVQCGEKSERS